MTGKTLFDVVAGAVVVEAIVLVDVVVVTGKILFVFDVIVEAVVKEVIVLVDTIDVVDVPS